MTDRIAVWQDANGELAVHPWEPVGGKSIRCAIAALREGSRVESNGWWPVVHCDGRIYSSNLPPSICRLVEPEAPSLGSSEVECVLVASSSRTDVAAPMSLEMGSKLIEENGSHEVLAAHYWANRGLQTQISAAISGARDYSVELANACLVASRVRDPKLWEPVAMRAKSSNNAAEACLRDWPDARGIDFFSAGLVTSGRPLLGNSLLFFLYCCPDTGLGCVSRLLGHPFLNPTDSVRAKEARGQFLKVLEDFYQLTGADAGKEWMEYGAASLLVSTLTRQDDWIAEKGLAVLGRQGNCRRIVLANKLKRDGIWGPDPGDPTQDKPRK